MRPRRSTIGVSLLATALAAGSCSCFVHIRSCWQRHERRNEDARHVVHAFDIGNALGSMASGILGGGDKEQKLPVTAADVLKDCKDALQTSLEQGYGKLDIEVPRGLRFGYEDTRQSPVMFEKSMRSRSRGLASDRELGYAFVTMLAPMAETICVAFQTPELAAAAKRSWKVDNMENIMKTKIRVLALGGGKSGRAAASFGSQRRALAEAAKSDSPGLALGTRLVKMECSLFVAVAPSPASLIAIKDVSNILGDNMGIVLLNARIHGRHRHEKLPDIEWQKLRKTFLPAYHLRFLEPDTDTVLYHKVMEDDMDTWILANQPKDDLARVTYKELLRTKGPPSRAQMAAVRDPSPVTTG